VKLCPQGGAPSLLLFATSASRCGWRSQTPGQWHTEAPLTCTWAAPRYLRQDAARHDSAQEHDRLTRPSAGGARTRHDRQERRSTAEVRQNQPDTVRQPLGLGSLLQTESDAAWVERLLGLVAKYSSYGVTADVASMGPADLIGLYKYLNNLQGGTGV
jgi:hypothetical protein